MSWLLNVKAPVATFNLENALLRDCKIFAGLRLKLYTATTSGRVKCETQEQPCVFGLRSTRNVSLNISWYKVLKVCKLSGVAWKMETDFTKFTLQQFYSVSSRYFQTFLFSFFKKFRMVGDCGILKSPLTPNIVGSPVGSVDSLKVFDRKCMRELG